MVPALAIISFNRPDYLRNRLLEILNQNILVPKVLVSIDGEKSSGISNRFAYDLLVQEFKDSTNIDFIFHEDNLGCDLHIKTVIDYMAERFQQFIIIEDDIEITNFFVAVMEVQLHKNPIVVGFSPFSAHGSFLQLFDNRWRKTPFFSAWGYGMNAATWKLFKFTTNQKEILQLLSQSTIWKSFSKYRKDIWLSRFSRGNFDFQVQLNLFALDLDVSLPFFRIVNNCGFSDSRSTHTTGKKPWSIFGNTYSTKMPSDRYLVRYIAKILIFTDRFLWVCDTPLRTRGRTVGIRTFLRGFFKSS